MNKLKSTQLILQEKYQSTERHNDKLQSCKNGTAGTNTRMPESLNDQKNREQSVIEKGVQKFKQVIEFRLRKWNKEIAALSSRLF